MRKYETISKRMAARKSGLESLPAVQALSHEIAHNPAVKAADKSMAKALSAAKLRKVNSQACAEAKARGDKYPARSALQAVLAYTKKITEENSRARLAALPPDILAAANAAVSAQAAS